MDSGNPNYVLGCLRAKRIRACRESLINFHGCFPAFFVVKETRASLTGRVTRSADFIGPHMVRAWTAEGPSSPVPHSGRRAAREAFTKRRPGNQIGCMAVGGGRARSFSSLRSWAARGWGVKLMNGIKPVREPLFIRVRRDFARPLRAAELGAYPRPPPVCEVRRFMAGTR